jgi:hypothetical protein
MISSLRNFSVRILHADRFTIVVFQILDIKSNYLPGIVQYVNHQGWVTMCDEPQPPPPKEWGGGGVISTTIGRRELKGSVPRPKFIVAYRCIIKECEKYIYNRVNNRLIGREFDILHYEGVLVPKVLLV